LFERKTVGLFASSFMPIFGDFIVGIALGVVTDATDGAPGQTLVSNILIWVGFVSLGQFVVCVIFAFALFYSLIKTKPNFIHMLQRL